MGPGTKLRCIDAKEGGIPIVEGQTYTVKVYDEDMSARAYRDTGEFPIADRRKEPGVILVEVPGHFMLNRFETV